MNRIKLMVTVTTVVLLTVLDLGHGQGLTLQGVTVTPHVQSLDMRYRKATDFSLGARAQIFVQNACLSPICLEPGTDIRVRGRRPKALVDADEWAWYDFPDAWDTPLTLAPEALTVWTWNGKREPWGLGTRADLQISLAHKDAEPIACQVSLAQPAVWLSAVTFLSQDHDPFPDQLIFHVANQTDSALRVEACRLWLPRDNGSRALFAGKWHTDLNTFPDNGLIPPHDRGGAVVDTGTLPLTYTALEVRLRDAGNTPVTVWTHVRIKREVFDISGGWVSSKARQGSTLTHEPYLKTLMRMHLNTAHIGEVRDYTDNPDLYAKYTLKRFNKLEDIDRYDTDAMLPFIHAVEFLGEPQYGGGRPVPPMAVWRELTPYRSTRLATTVTHSEERIWRFYAGLSDYPHYDAYRVSAPAADSWGLYDRWGEDRIRWGAPLETIGTLTRSLRELNRPAPMAYWSQGAHHGWGHYGARERTSPTAQELRAQAYHALAARITSLYWFNLSLKSILMFPDLIEPITLVGREIRLLEDYYVQGDATHYARVNRAGKPDWDVSVVAGPKGGVLFALDLDYRADPEDRVFKFNAPRDAVIEFDLPVYMRNPGTVLRVNAHEVTSVPFDVTPKGIRIKGRFKDVNVFVSSHRTDAQDILERRRKALVAVEASFEFNPGQNASDLAQLKAIMAD
ncbi:MAG: hypothetical protein HQ515_03895 [Phycisphaeraceae bacterium]|nr:hypothetical protein [Phycisphaeraceae bacterium]